MPDAGQGRVGRLQEYDRNQEEPRTVLKNCPEFIAECRSVRFAQGSQKQAVDKSASVCVRDSFRLSLSERDQCTVSTTVDTSSEDESTRSSENEEFSQAKRTFVDHESLDFTARTQISQVTANRGSLTSPERAHRSRRSTDSTLTPLEFTSSEDLEGFVPQSKLIERIRELERM